MRRGGQAGWRPRAGVIALLLGLFLAAGAAYAGPNPEKGKRTALKWCGRCHVVGQANRHGGIDSTPSFYLLARNPEYLDRVTTFFERRPHPVFVRVPGVDRWSKAPAYADEFTMTTDDIENVRAYIETLTGKKLKPVRRKRR